MAGKARAIGTFILGVITLLVFIELGRVLLRRPEVQKALHIMAPCQRPITYRIGTVDPRFGIGADELKAAVSEAASEWSGPLGRTLFVYSDQGTLAINLSYDDRQSTTDSLKNINSGIIGGKASYSSLKSLYDSKVAAYASKKSAYEAGIRNFELLQRSYESEVRKWDGRGGASAGVYSELQREHDALSAQADALNRERDELNSLVNEINSLAASLNSLASNLNQQVRTYNEIGSSLGDSYEDGLYTSDAGGASITIYQFDNHEKLVRVLAHELGHALGLDHLDDPQALMYALSSGSNTSVTSADITAFKQECGLH